MEIKYNTKQIQSILNISWTGAAFGAVDPAHVPAGYVIEIQISCSYVWITKYFSMRCSNDNVWLHIEEFKKHNLLRYRKLICKNKFDQQKSTHIHTHTHITKETQSQEKGTHK